MKKYLSIIALTVFMSVTAMVLIFGKQLDTSGEMATPIQAKPTSFPGEVAEIWNAHVSELAGIAFSYPESHEIIEESRNSLILTMGDSIIQFSTLEDVPIHTLRMCSFAKEGACLYDSYSGQDTIFADFLLDGKKAKSFYARDKDGNDWHVVSLSVYEEFQIKMLLNSLEDDVLFTKLIDSVDFLDNNEK